jgi:hypothetical protein
MVREWEQEEARKQTEKKANDYKFCVEANVPVSKGVKEFSKTISVANLTSAVIEGEKLQNKFPEKMRKRSVFNIWCNIKDHTRKDKPILIQLCCIKGVISYFDYYYHDRMRRLYDLNITTSQVMLEFFKHCYDCDPVDTTKFLFHLGAEEGAKVLNHIKNL